MENNWISVEDLTPNTEEYVLVYLDNTKEVWVASYYKNEWVIDESGQTNDVTHWMLLPKQPNTIK